MTFGYSEMTTKFENENESTADNVVLMIQDEEPMVRPSTYLAWSLFNSICCFVCCCNWFTVPFSIPALIYSLKARENINAGKTARAAANGRISKFLNYIVMFIVIIPIVAAFIIVPTAYYYINYYVNRTERVIFSEIVESAK